MAEEGKILEQIIDSIKEYFDLKFEFLKIEISTITGIQKSHISEIASLREECIRLGHRIVLLEKDQTNNKEDVKKEIDELKATQKAILAELKKKNRWPLVFLLSVISSPLVVKLVDFIIMAINIKKDN